MTLPEIEAQCARLGWTLANDWSEHGGVESVIYKPTPGVVHERTEIGRGEAAHAAYLAACERAGVTPF